jgi:hypothetical protein
MCPVLDSSSFASVLTLPRRTCLNSASSVLAVRSNCHSVRVQKALMYQLSITILFVTWLYRSEFSAVSCNCDWSWNVLLFDTGGTPVYMSCFMNMSCRLNYNCTVFECQLMCSRISVVCAELMSSNKKYAAKQKQYKLFAGKSVSFHTFCVPTSHCYPQQRSTFK